MRKRPPLKQGDLCRYHKSTIQQRKAKGLEPNPLMVVINTTGYETTDGRAKITVRYLSRSVSKGSNLKGKKKFVLPRRRLWKCERHEATYSGASVVQEVLKMVGM